MSYADGGVVTANLATAQRREQAARRRAVTPKTALRAFAARVREIEEDLYLPHDVPHLLSRPEAGAALRGARIEAMKTLETR